MVGKLPLYGRDAHNAVAEAPDDVIAEVLGGELHSSPRPRVRHSRAASVLGGKLGNRFDYGDDGPGEWILLDEPELHLGEGPDIVVPDQASWRRKRVPEFPDAAAIEIAPDWVCEVLSPATEAIDRGKKRDIYAREGVGYLWLVAPGPRVLEVFALAGTTYQLVGTWSGNDDVQAPPFEAFSLALADLWRW